MAFRLLHISLDSADVDRVCDCIESLEPQNLWVAGTSETDAPSQVFAVVHTTRQQEVMDAVAEALEGRSDWRMLVQDLRATLPEIEDEDRRARNERQTQLAAREEIFAQVKAESRITVDYLVLTALATVVAAIGLNSDQVAVVIGAMVIAPLLGPILAFSFGTALGNRALLRDSALSFAGGLAVSVLVGGALGFVVPVNLDSALLNYTEPLGLTTLALPVASGAAAGLMVAQGRVSALVGVMVAAALLPPVSAFGLLLGAGEHVQAARALSTVAINVIAITLAAQVVFVAKGVRPRKYLGESHKSSIRLNIGTCLFLVVGAGVAIWWL